MELLKFINKLFCTMSVFCGVTKTYAQREIHPLETLFTYDYALKTYMNLATISSISSLREALPYSYWLLDNFKTPDVDVSRLEYTNEMTSLVRLGRLYDRTHIEKTIHYFNSDTGYLKQTFALRPYLTGVSDTVYNKNYKYEIDNINTKIYVEHIFSRSSSEMVKNRVFTYLFENKTENLLQIEIIFDNKVEFFIVFEYNDEATIKNIKSNGVSFSSETDKIKSNPVNFILFPPGFSKSPKIWLNNRSDISNACNYKAKISYSNNGISRTFFNNINFSAHHIYCNTTLSSTVDSDFLMIFDDNKKLEQFHTYTSFSLTESSLNNPKKWQRAVGNYRVLSKKNNKKWTYSTSYVFRKKLLNGFTQFRSKSTETYQSRNNNFYINNNVIYKMN